MSDKALIKRTMAEVRLMNLGVIAEHESKKRSRYGRNTLYKMLRDRNYEWDSKYSIWAKAS